MHLLPCVTTFFLVSLNPCFTQSAENLRDFPKLANIAKNRKITTSPTDSTCGIPVRNAFCKSSPLKNSIENCVLDYCVQTCPTRETLPRFLDQLIASSRGFGSCITTDTINTRPGSSDKEFATLLLQAGDNCYLSPDLTPFIDSSGAFTITVWVWPDRDQTMSLWEKVASHNPSSILLAVRVNSTHTQVTYHTSDGLFTIEFLATLPLQTWTHLALQVHGTSLSVFLNGGGEANTASFTTQLEGILSDRPGAARIGQTHQGNHQYVGRLQDFRFYTDTLTNRDIALVYSGELPRLRIQTLCRCPSSHPRVSPLVTHLCVTNDASDNTRDTASRINKESHPLEYINDGDSNSVWISLFHDVTLILDLGDDFQVFYVVMQFYSPMPRAVKIERQVNLGSWVPWQYYADDCITQFNMSNNGALVTPNSVNCIQLGSKNLPAPLSRGNITFNILSQEPVRRPDYNDFYNSPVLQEFVSSSKVRISLKGHMAVTAFRHRYFGVYELIVSGRCDCHGHARACDLTQLPYKCNCTEDSHSTGRKCNECEPLYNDKQFRRGTQEAAYNCRPCQCYNHASTCVYNRSIDSFPDHHDKGGGGVCVNCQHNTVGRHCESCIETYYRPVGASLYDEGVCQPCGCSSIGIINGSTTCNQIGGQCDCKLGVSGRTCDRCKVGYYSLDPNNPQGCSLCGCDARGTKLGDISCDDYGQCVCKNNVIGRTCTQCKHGYYNFDPSDPAGCRPCNCHPHGSTTSFCNPSTGQCLCKPNVGGLLCEQCKPGYYDFASLCVPCSCNVVGAVPGTTCNKTSGQCVCKQNTEGITCDRCRDGSYDFGGSSQYGCIDCGCDTKGVRPNTTICDKSSGMCQCKNSVTGRRCNTCVDGTWNLALNNSDGCEQCFCDITGVADASCNLITGVCNCLSNRVGDKCDDCATGFFLNSTGPAGGCLPCNCHPRATLVGTNCNSVTGQCECRWDGAGVTGRTCSQCFPLFFEFNDRTGSCKACGCSDVGSLNATCHPKSGQCKCKPLTDGLKCNTCKLGSSGLASDNPYGCSNYPQQQPPVSFLNVTSTFIQLSWMKPDYPNGIIRFYLLYRNRTIVSNITATSRETIYTDRGLRPYVVYAYIVEAFNDHGSVESQVAYIRTLAGPPAGNLSLSVTAVTARTASFLWREPTQINGVIRHYELSSVEEPTGRVETHWRGLEHDTTISGLQPFTNYSFSVRACTEGGCLFSDNVSVSTFSALPLGQGQPTVTTINSTALYIQWHPPSEPNGVIIFYELWMRGGQSSHGVPHEPEASRIFHPAGQYNPRLPPDSMQQVLPAPATNHTAVNLLPYKRYEFQVLAENDVGKAASSWAAGRTGETAPLKVRAPKVHAVSSRKLNVSWLDVRDDEMRGAIVLFRLMILRDTDVNTDPFAPPKQWKEVNRNSGTHRYYVMSNLQPYTEYSFKLEACTKIGCLNSSQATGTTHIAAPEGVQEPTVISYNSSTVKITWSVPSMPNGPQPYYTIEKSSVALNYPPQRLERGTRFPGKGYYKFPPETIPQNVAFTGIRFWFRTSQRDSLILFAASGERQEEFIFIQLRVGRPRLVFDAQGCMQIVESPTTSVNDGKWHQLLMRRSGSKGFLQIDSDPPGCLMVIFTTDDEGRRYNDNKWHHMSVRRRGTRARIQLDHLWTGESLHDCNHKGTIIGRNNGVYIGSLPNDYLIKRQFHKEDGRGRLIREAFQGCLRDFEILRSESPVDVWKPLNWETALKSEQALPNWEGCQLDLSSNFYHFMGRGYALVDKEFFTGGNTFTISLQLRTEMQSGILFFSYGGTGIYVIIHLLNGDLLLEFSDGVTKTTVTYEKSLTANFCDGQFKMVTFEKSGQQGRIDVKDMGERKSGVSSVAMSITTASPLFLGGVPDNPAISEFIEKSNIQASTEGFGGCTRNIRINNHRLDYTRIAQVLNVNLDGCPEQRIPLESCQKSYITRIYNGTELLTYDASLQSYSEYLYRLVVHNAAGSAHSRWVNVRTREGVPEGVQPPINLEALSGYEINVTWTPPLSSSGLLRKFMLKAYNLENPELSAIMTEFNTSVLNGIIRGVKPYTNYSIHLSACTSGGCTESTGRTVFTKEEAPQDVGSPYAQPGPTYLFIMWDPPALPNGVLTGYILKMEGIQVYTGNQLYHNVTGLQVYTAYRFQLSACTVVGCTNGTTKTISTTQLPPTFVNKPTLHSLGTRQVEARWTKPEQLNGVLARYLLYLSTEQNDIGDVVYNNSDLFTDSVIKNLTPGTIYFIRLSACTAGGCRLSDAANVTTEEHSPTGVGDPHVFSPTSSRLIVTWKAPDEPNGVIIKYILSHNGLDVYTSVTPTVYQVDKLRPFSLHTFRLAACTVKGCGYSREVEARTLEAKPVGYVVMDVRLIPGNERSVEVKWSLPSQPNGHLFYDVYFKGLFYADPDKWNYTTVNERRRRYRGDTYEEWILISNLIPFTTYVVQVNASNTRGHLLSNRRTIILPQGTPDGVKPPTLESRSPTSITAIWRPVGRANSLQDPLFILQFRDQPQSAIEDIFGPTMSMSYTKRNLKPFHEYSFRLIARNNVGDTVSDWSAHYTRQDRPGDIDPPLIKNIGDVHMNIYWLPPAQANGIINKYRIFQNNVFLISVLGNVTDLRVTDLVPYTNYSFVVEACNVAGCSRSDASVTVRTMPRVAEGIPPLILISRTPTSVQISWSVPSRPNGPIKEYVLERRKQGTKVPVIIETFGPDKPRLYVDEAAVLSPYTEYQYRLGVVNVAGTSSGPWTNITTKSSRPGGMIPPTISAITPRSLTVSWDAPLQPNGVIEFYIVRMPVPRIEVRDVTHRKVNVTNLRPFTRYDVTVTACTVGGCSESAAVKAVTEGTVPEDQGPPSVYPTSQSSITVNWQPPLRPNGPDISYELQRQKTAQPLYDAAIDFGIWKQLYKGDGLYYEDRGLPTLTTYIYRVTVYNLFGPTTSLPSRHVTTDGGFPKMPPNVTLTVLDHVSMFVSWTTPDINVLRGYVTKYTVHAHSQVKNFTHHLDHTHSNVTLRNLTPRTKYTIRVTVTVNGGANITSVPVSATTLDGAPAGLAAPTLKAVSDTEMLVMWRAPERANGLIIGYNIYLDDSKITTNLTEAASYRLSDLRPHTVYRVQVEVCTVHDCTRSPVTLGTTREAPPQGIERPYVTTHNSTALLVTWQSPGQPNGIIKEYTIRRRTRVPCSSTTLKSRENTYVPKCKYVTCSAFEKLCADQCYTGAKVCCDGVVHDSKPGYECCGTSFIASRLHPRDVCCGGRFHSWKSNHECCTNRYVEVGNGKVCCSAKHENRVAVGYGDQCCNSVPYSSFGSQICCAGELHDRYERQCCGGVMVKSEYVCCGDKDEGKVHTQITGHVCCGQEYLDSAISLCCHSETGQTKLHTYRSNKQKLAANERCCGLEKISPGLSCCHSVGYNSESQVCADMSYMQTGCGEGVVCSVSHTHTAFCDRCDFNKSTHYCGSAPRQPDRPLAKANQSGDCVSELIRVYSGLSFSYLDVGLTPFTTYEYTLTVVNGAGSSSSAYTKAITAQAIPRGVHPPSAMVKPEYLYIIWLSWKIPDNPNGILSHYILRRNELELYKGPALTFIDDNAILPYQSYYYTIAACNSVGCASSIATRVATAEAAPEGVPSPEVTVLSARSVLVEWTTPTRTNGDIIRYGVLQNGHVIVNVTKKPWRYTISDLQPYSSYTYSIQACTQAGCTQGSNVTVETFQGAPEGMLPPVAVVVSSTTIELYWQPPENPNGVILGYRVFQRGDGVITQSRYSAQSRSSMHILLPNTVYTFSIEARNVAGALNSSAIAVRMPNHTLPNLPAPKIARVLNSTSIYIEWDAPFVTSHMVVDNYKVVLNAETNNKIEIGVGKKLNHTVSNLTPNTLYSVRIMVCLANYSNGCGLGPGAVVRTFEALPLQQPAPTVTAVGPSAVDIAWKPPLKPNGYIISYQVHQKEYGSSSVILINRVDRKTFSFRHAGSDLVPYTKYLYRVTSFNSQGQAESPWTAVRTLEAPPAGLDAPHVKVTGAYSVDVSWKLPSRKNGVITIYKVEYGKDTGAEFNHITVGGQHLAAIISGLSPYTEYAVRVVAINHAGQVTSKVTKVITDQASPSGVGEFSIEKVDTGTSVILTWRLPKWKNGILTHFAVHDLTSNDSVTVYMGLDTQFEYRRLQPFTEYVVQLEACTIAGCTFSKKQSFVTAEVTPEVQLPPTMGFVNSTHVLLMWNAPTNPNGKILSYEVLRRSVSRDVNNQNALHRLTKRYILSKKPEQRVFKRHAYEEIMKIGGQHSASRHVIVKRDTTQPKVIHRITDTDSKSYSYLDSDLLPFRKYDYRIRVTNSRGSKESDWITVTTKQAPPQGLLAPIVSYIDGSVNSLLIKWSNPTQTNGIIQYYKLQRNDTTPWSFSVSDPKRFIDKGLNPYTVYSYRLTVCTGGGCSQGSATTLRTYETSPLLVLPPTLKAVNSTAIIATWQPPQITNGRISEYRLFKNSVRVYSGQALQYVVTDLIPYHEYMFYLTACTRGGCSDSMEVSGRPLASPPSGLAAPTLKVLSSTSIIINWRPPKHPNGIITSYDLRRDNQLITSESLIIAGILRTTYTDYNLDPGIEYSYTITASNSEGNVTSLKAVARTFDAAPSNMKPPILEPVSSTSIRATWKAPEKPNGIIRNYTLYMENKVIFSGGPNARSYIIPGLLFWTVYMFRVQACTQRGCDLSSPSSVRTLESEPQEQRPPLLTPLTDEHGAHNGVEASWVEPVKPNGIITNYTLWRRAVVVSDEMSFGPQVVLFIGLQEIFVDRSVHLRANQLYQYRVSVGNSAGTTTSVWKNVRTKEAPPLTSPKPAIINVTTISITVKISEPSTPNGVITRYDVIINGTSESSGKQLIQTVGSRSPYTLYSVQVDSCTMPGCTRSLPVIIRTKPAPPGDVAAVKVSELKSRSVMLSWSPPERPNGDILRYLVYKRLSCPHTEQPFYQPPCIEGQPDLVYDGLQHSMSIVDLVPYTSYSFKVEVENNVAISESDSWVKAQTLPTAPEYSHFPRLTKNGSKAYIDWSMSFHLNSRLRLYSVMADDFVVYEGLLTSHGVERSSRYTSIVFVVTVTTENGNARTPRVVFDPTKSNNIGTSPKVTPKADSVKEVYEEVWFIILICCLVVIIIIVIVILCLRGPTRARPLTRARDPLPQHGSHSRSNKSLLYSIEPNNDSIFTVDSVRRDKKQRPEGGTTNPLYAQDDSLDMVVQQLSRMSTQSLNSFNNDYDSDIVSWDGRQADSGLYDEDSISGAPYSKEQTLFTDTHI